MLKKGLFFLCVYMCVGADGRHPMTGCSIKMCGGGWLSNPEYIGGARESAAPTRTFFDIGFRCMWSPTDRYRQK